MNPKPIRNKYCIDKEDLVIPFKCECCRQCYLFVQSKNIKLEDGNIVNKNGTCPYGGPFNGYNKKDAQQE